jgi:hypothetical protein
LIFRPTLLIKFAIIEILSKIAIDTLHHVHTARYPSLFPRNASRMAVRQEPHMRPHDLYLTTWNAFDLYVSSGFIGWFTTFFLLSASVTRIYRISLMVTNSVITMSCLVRRRLVLLSSLQPGGIQTLDLVDSHITQTVAMLTLSAGQHHTITVRTYCHQLYIHNLNGAMSFTTSPTSHLLRSRALTQLLHTCVAYKPQRWLLPRFL